MALCNENSSLYLWILLLDEAVLFFFMPCTFDLLLLHFIFLFLLLITKIVHEFCQVTSLKMTRHQKRKIDETHVEVNTSQILTFLFSEFRCSILFIFLFENLKFYLN
jgi:hypothetical protein